jgi:hypothetical protein
MESQNIDASLGWIYIRTQEHRPHNQLILAVESNSLARVYTRVHVQDLKRMKWPFIFLQIMRVLAQGNALPKIDGSLMVNL